MTGQDSHQAHQRREVRTDVLKQTATIERRVSDGYVWLYVPRGMCLTPDEAWAFAQALLQDTE